jgi:hypothetical protein
VRRAGRHTTRRRPRRRRSSARLVKGSELSADGAQRRPARELPVGAHPRTADEARAKGQHVVDGDARRRGVSRVEQRRGDLGAYALHRRHAGEKLRPEHLRAADVVRRQEALAGALVRDELVDPVTEDEGVDVGAVDDGAASRLGAQAHVRRVSRLGRERGVAVDRTGSAVDLRQRGHADVAPGVGEDVKPPPSHVDPYAAGRLEDVAGARRVDARVVALPVRERMRFEPRR